MKLLQIVNAHLTLQALFAYHDIPIPPCFKPSSEDGAKIGRWWRDNGAQPAPVEALDGDLLYRFGSTTLRRNRNGEMVEVTP